MAKNYDPDPLVRKPWDSGYTPFERSTCYSRIKDGRFPAPVKIGRLSCWPARELARMNQALVQGQSDDEMRQLVKDLVSRRSARGDK